MLTITKQIIDAVFSDPRLAGRFLCPKSAKAICELRLTGEPYTEIAKKTGRSAYFSRDCVYKTVFYYRVYLEEKS